MTVNTSGPIQRATTRTESSVDIDKLRVLIAEHLEVDVRHVTDYAHLNRDLGADWLDRLELIILVEEIAGVEITTMKPIRSMLSVIFYYINKRPLLTPSQLFWPGLLFIDFGALLIEIQNWWKSR